MRNVLSKICTNCEKNKVLTDYYKRTAVPDGRCSECKECSKLRNKHNHKNYYSKHKNKILEKNKNILKTIMHLISQEKIN
jgi:hypothetical protein